MKSLPSPVYALLFAFSIVSCSGPSESPKVSPPAQSQAEGQPPPAQATPGDAAMDTRVGPLGSPVEESPATPNPPTEPLVEAPAPELPAPSTETPEIAPAPQIARFLTWLDLIEHDLMQADPSQVPDLLYKNKTREKVFNIQALGRIYKDVDPAFKELHNRFRDLEDAIGDYQKWADYEVEGIAKGASETVLAKLKANREAGHLRLLNTLQDANFLPSKAGDVPYTVALRQFLLNYKWPSVEADRSFVVKEMVDELEKTKTAIYDFSHLEKGNGVHEFRRKLRWFSMEARGMNGLFTLKPQDTKCPVKSWSNLIHDSIATTKYAVLPPASSEPNPIALTPCLYIKVARLVEDVNGIKAKFEAAETFSEEDGTDLVAEPDRLLVKAMYDDMMANDLLGRLQIELLWGLNGELHSSSR